MELLCCATISASLVAACFKEVLLSIRAFFALQQSDTVNHHDYVHTAAM